MVRLAALACGAALVLASAASAQGRLPGGRALVADVSVSPSTHLFGDEVVARIDLVADAREFDPAALRVVPRFAPYRVAGGIREERRESDGLVHVRYEATLRCLHVGCLAPRAQSPLGAQEEGRAERHTITLPPVEILYRGKLLLVRHFPALQVVSRLNTANTNRSRSAYAASLVPPGPTYRARPKLLAGAALVAAFLLALFPAALGWRSLRARWLQSRRWRPLPPLERALVLVEWTSRRDDAGDDRRKALESLATALERDGEHSLADAARRAAWTEEPPARDRAGALGTEARRTLDGGGRGRSA